MLTILLGNLIVLVPMLLNAHAGAKYGIPMPVFVRASFGTRGANIPAVLRAIAAPGSSACSSPLPFIFPHAVSNFCWRICTLELLRHSSTE